jgi:ketosteroid isomerase-like protein
MAGVAAVALGACGAPDRNTAEESRAELMRRFAAAYNEQSPGWFEEFHAPGYTWEGVGPWARSGSRLTYEQMLGMIGEEARRFPDRRMEIRRLVVDGDQVALHYEWTGTAAMDLGPLHAGEVQRWDNLLFVTVRDGKMTEAHEFGVQPAQPAAAEAPAP